ncbi:MAG: type II toxin-antitoxin system Phd/YefM family antitoxin [Hyphomonadaceae bacterium]|nr:type II toxin-antitoxin system Phd/YefM family antitoxin [Clostridia bacterium]
MPMIKPSSELRNSYNEISNFCHKYNEPVYITKNGQGDLAVMSIETYEKLVGRYELYSLLEQGEKEIEKGNVIPVEDVFSSIESRILKW